MRDSSDAARLVELLDGVEVGLVALASEGDVARVNNTAASLVGVSPGTIPAAEFAEALGRLAARSVDSARAESQIASVASDPLGELRTTWQFPESPQHLGVFSRPPTQPLTGGRIWVFYENSMLDEAIDAANLAYGLVRTNTDAILDPQVLVEAIRSGGKIVDLVYRDVNRATCEYLGLSRDELIGHSLMETLPNLVGSGLFEIYSNCADTGELVLLDGFPYHNELLDDLRYYDIRAAHARQDMISLTWRDVTDRIQWSQQISASEQRYRLLAENMGDVVLVIRDGRIDWISNSVEKALGAPPDYFTGRLATDFIPQDQLPAAAERLEEGTRGKSYIGPAQLLDTAGTTRAIHLHTKPFFDADGETDGLVASFHVIDEEVAARKRAQEQIELTDQRNRSLTRRLQAQTNRLMAELNSAAKYVASILPEELDGPVRVTSRLVASQELAGDSFDYQWLDDDHLMVYLIDVSGHGVESALELYRHQYRPSPRYPTPHATICVWALAADTEAEAWHQVTSREHWRVGFEKGLREPLISPDEAALQQYTPGEQLIIDKLRRKAIVGTKEQVAEKLTALAERLELDELVVVTWTYDTAPRHRSYELLAEAFGLNATLKAA